MSLVLHADFYGAISLTIKEIINPIKPIAKIPMAEIFATIRNSFFCGFFKTYQTRIHFFPKALKSNAMT